MIDWTIFVAALVGTLVGGGVGYMLGRTRTAAIIDRLEQAHRNNQQAMSKGQRHG